MNNGTENTPHARVVPWALSDEETALFNQSLDVAVDLAKSPLDLDKGTGQIIAGLCAVIHQRTDAAAFGYMIKTDPIAAIRAEFPHPEDDAAVRRAASTIVERLHFDAARCEVAYSKGIAGNIEEGIAVIERLQAIIRQAIEAYDSGNLQISSPEIGEPENDIPMHPWHEEWLHHARALVEER